MFPVLYNMSLCSYFIPNCLYLLIPYPPYIAPLPIGNHWFVLYICESAYILLYSLICFIFF